MSLIIMSCTLDPMYFSPRLMCPRTICLGPGREGAVLTLRRDMLDWYCRDRRPGILSAVYTWVGLGEGILGFPRWPQGTWGKPKFLRVGFVIIQRQSAVGTHRSGSQNPGDHDDPDKNVQGCLVQGQFIMASGCQPIPSPSQFQTVRLQHNICLSIQFHYLTLSESTCSIAVTIFPYRCKVKIQKSTSSSIKPDLFRIR